jgi:hypothetical protein
MENLAFWVGYPNAIQKLDFFFFFNVFIPFLFFMTSNGTRFKCNLTQPVGGLCWWSKLAILDVAEYNATNSFLHQPEQHNYAAIGNSKRNVEKIVGDKGKSWCWN